MSEVLDMAAVAALVGDPARANILFALLDGRNLSASELAYAARVSPQTASGHLGKLAAARLIDSKPQGRHRYYRLAGPHVAVMIESIMAVVAVSPPRQVPCRIEEPMRGARLCYDHVAGRLGVALADALVARGYAELAAHAGVVTGTGLELLGRIGIDVDALLVRRGKRPARILCRPCLDWSERRPHLAGAVGAALCAHSLGEGWVRRIRDTRAVAITPKGQRMFREVFGVEVG